jgi:hypothetical protein
MITIKYIEGFCLVEYNVACMLKVNWGFGGFFPLQGRRGSQAINQHEATSKQNKLGTKLTPARITYLLYAFKIKELENAIEITGTFDLLQGRKEFC